MCIVYDHYDDRRSIIVDVVLVCVNEQEMKSSLATFHVLFWFCLSYEGK